VRCCLKDIVKSFGGGVKYIVSGGAPLNSDIINEFKCYGIEILNGYGITECSPVVSCNNPTSYRKNSVGRPDKEFIDVKIVDDEILVSGEMVMKGYYNDSFSTKEAFYDGWFRTGDLGYIDKDGFLFITGRKKNLIILSNGENVSAEEIEGKLLKKKHIKETIVYPKKIGKNVVLAAKIVLDISQTDDREKIENAIRNEIMEINRKSPNYKQIKSVEFQDNEFEKNGSGKIIRSKAF